MDHSSTNQRLHAVVPSQLARDRELWASGAECPIIQKNVNRKSLRGYRQGMEVNGYKIEPGANLSGADLAHAGLAHAGLNGTDPSKGT